VRDAVALRCVYLARRRAIPSTVSSIKMPRVAMPQGASEGSWGVGTTVLIEGTHRNLAIVTGASGWVPS
jgi:hypothetical protein